MAVGAVEADGIEQDNLDDGIEEAENHVVPQRDVDNALLEGKTNPERNGDHQVDDQRIGQDIDSVQQLLVFFYHRIASPYPCCRSIKRAGKEAATWAK